MTRIFLIYFLLLTTVGLTQRTPEVFGQNRIQYKSNKWRKFETNNFEIYYYKGGEELARTAAEFAEKDHKRIANILGYYSFKKINLIVYNSISDLKQSNIGLEKVKYQTGSDTKYIKNNIEVAFNSTLSDLKNQITSQISNVLITELLYGNGMSQLIQSSYFVELPQWFTKGLVNYITYGWSVEMDNYLRVGKLPSGMSGVNNLKNKNAKLIGQSIWNYIVEEYGSDAIKNIVTFVRLSRDEKIAITNTLGIDYKSFYKSYEKFYNKILEVDLANLKDVSTVEYEISNNNKNLKFVDLKISPDGKKLAYTTNSNGKVSALIKDLETNKTKKVFKQGIKNRSFEQSENLPVLSWRNNNDLYAIYRGENEWSFFKDDKLVQISGNSLILKNLTGKGRRKYLKKYDQIQSFSFSDDGSQMLLSVVEKGQSNIVLYMPKINKTLKLTEDIYDDIDPVFEKEGVVLFSSNRDVYDEGFKKGSANEINNNYDVFELKVFDKNDRIRPITKSLSNEKNISISDQSLYYLSNKTGINSLYNYSLLNNKSDLISQFSQNIEKYDIKNNVIYLITNEENKNNIYSIPLNEIDNKPVITYRQKLMNDRTKAYYLNKTDSVNIILDEPKKVTKSKIYPLKFSLNKIHSGVKIDPLLGFGTVLDITMTDKMENHSISGGIFALSDFASHTIHAEYNYLKRRVDLGVKYERENYIYTNSSSLDYLKFGAQKFKLKATLPFNFSNNITLKTGWVQTRQVTYNLTSLIQEDFVTDFANTELSYVLDNTTKEGLNMLKGTRMKISIDNMLGFRTSDTNLVSASKESFRTFKFDLRNYKEIFKTFTWANRLSFGTSRGNAPKTFLFGGMDNWLVPKTDLNEIPETQYTSDVLYLSYITSMRGFNYNVRNGNNFVLLNSELRLAYKKLTSFSTYKSNLIENLQFVFFTDLGTAWTGNNPTSKENSINKSTFGGGGDPYKITVYNYRSPLVMGFGGGVRTVLLGTYVKLDLGWGVEDFKIRGPKLYLTLGYDF